MRPAVYIPHHEGAERLGAALRGLGEQTRPVDVIVVDNGSADGSRELLEREFPEVEVVALGRNLGFGPALNRAVEERPADPLILLNNDAVPEARFVEALLETAAMGAEMVAGVTLRGDDRALIDSAGVVADGTLMGFDYLHGEPLAALAGAAAPLGPTGGAALYRHGAFRAAGGFDERIFLYYEDLDLALRLRAAGARCELAGEARAAHAYSASLGVASAEKYARTGWSRGYMLRRYGVMLHPTSAARALACEAVLCAGQLLRDRTAKGLVARLRGWHDAAGLERRDPPRDALLDIPAREALALRKRRRG